MVKVHKTHRSELGQAHREAEGIRGRIAFILLFHQRKQLILSGCLPWKASYASSLSPPVLPASPPPLLPLSTVLLGRPEEAAVGWIIFFILFLLKFAVTCNLLSLLFCSVCFLNGSLWRVPLSFLHHLIPVVASSCYSGCTKEKQGWMVRAHLEKQMARARAATVFHTCSASDFPQGSHPSGSGLLDDFQKHIWWNL